MNSMISQIGTEDPHCCEPKALQAEQISCCVPDDLEGSSAPELLSHNLIASSEHSAKPTK